MPAKLKKYTEYFNDFLNEQCETIGVLNQEKRYLYELDKEDIKVAVNKLTNYKNFSKNKFRRKMLKVDVWYNLKNL